MIRQGEANSYKENETLPQDSPEQLMQRALAGDEKAYASLLRSTGAMLRSYLARRINQPSEVEDILQEILLSIHKARHTYDGKRPYKPWAFAIARFRLADHLRQHYADQLRQASELDEAQFIFASDVTESGLTYESIKEEIDRLSGKQPTILHMLHREGHTAKEVASKLGMTETAVKVAAHRAYKILRKKLAS